MSTPTVERMRDSSARRRSGRARVVLPGAAPVALLAVLLAGCAGKDEDKTPEAQPTPISSLNTTAMDVARIDFCPLVPDEAVSDALDGEPDSDAAYGNGDKTSVPGVGSDVVHEIGCSWSKDDGTTARAWVFARPVTPAFARTVVASARKAAGCRVVTGPAFGKPSATQVCRAKGGVERVRHAGLFGQTWLTCEVSAAAPRSEVRARTDRWCVQVVNAVNSAR